MWINLPKTDLENICRALRDSGGLETGPDNDSLAERLETDMKNRLDPESDKWVSAAMDKYLSAGGTDGDIDFDSDAVVSDSEAGAYVMMWGWVRNSEVGLLDPEDDDEVV